MGSKYKTEFNEIRSLGRGAFSTVFEVKYAKNSKDNKSYAIKKIPFENKQNVKTDTLKEVKILNELQSVYVIKFIDCWIETNYYLTDKIDAFLNRESLLFYKENELLLHLQMELCPVTLEKFIQLITGPKQNVITMENYRIVCELFKQILESLFYLHHHNPPIIHRDIKPANIMLTNEGNGRKVKLTDFGLSTYHRFIEESKSKYVGTESFRAPETNDKNYDTKVDIYSVGLVMQKMFNFNFNTFGDNENDNELSIRKLYTKVSEACLKCLSFVPRGRPTSDQLLEDCSSWFRIQNETYDSFNTSNNINYTKLINSFSVTSRYKSEFFETRLLSNDYFTTVFEARELKSGTIFTIKKHAFKDSRKIFALKEIEFLKDLSNEFVVAYVDSWIEDNYYLNDGQDNRLERYNDILNPDYPLLLHIQFEYYSITLDHFIKHQKYNKRNIITSDEFRKCCQILVKLLQCVDYIHQKNVIHRDLKPKNIILFNTEDGYRVKLAEFILSTYHNFVDQSHTKYIGTPYYKAPELMNSDYTTKVDIYSLGVIIQKLFNIDINSDSNENSDEIKCNYEKVREILEECVSPSPNRRPTCKQLLERMNDWHNS